ncbi:MAG: DUF5362 domain-containing protein [Halomonas sp.]|uniref:DUF5362 domain-containing protein n=1 Tax=Halomonas sp. TaxID=1486246 RepID=UPI003F91FA80
MEPINQTPPTSPSGSPYELRDIIEPLYRSRFWMQLLGVMLILTGLLTALSIIGIVVAWIPVWAGVALFQAASAAKRGYESSSEADIKQTMNKLRTYFLISGIMTLLYVLFMVATMLLGFGGAMMGMDGMGSMSGY